MEINNQEAPPPETENRASIEARPPLSASLVATDDKGGDKAKAAATQAAPARRVLRDDERLAALGCPVVVIETLPWQTMVTVIRTPWGYGDLSRLFLGRSHRSAERYAQGLFDGFCEAADARKRYHCNRKANNRAFREIGRMLERREGRQ